MFVTQHKFELFADYHQFYLQDEYSDGDLTDELGRDDPGPMFAVGEGVVCVFTARNMTVPVTVEIYDSKPALNLDDWDHVAECSLEFETGTLVIRGCTDDFDDAPRFKINSGEYRLRLEYGKLSSLSENWLEGDDNYTVKLWPSEFAEPAVLKQWPGRKGAT